MSTNKTTNYSLNQWIKSDQVKMEEFNADNAKIDAALASKASTSALNSLQSVVNGKASTSALSSLQSTVSGQGTALALRNCRVVTGSYSGNGAYGSANPNTLTFPHKPVFVCVVSTETVPFLLLVRDQPSAYAAWGATRASQTLTWGDRSVSWYNTDSASSQLNQGTYYYFAALEIE